MRAYGSVGFSFLVAGAATAAGKTCGPDVYKRQLAVYPGARMKEKDSGGSDKSANVNISGFGYGPVSYTHLSRQCNSFAVNSRANRRCKLLSKLTATTPSAR